MEKNFRFVGLGALTTLCLLGSIIASPAALAAVPENAHRSSGLGSAPQANAHRSQLQDQGCGHQ